MKKFIALVLIVLILFSVASFLLIPPFSLDDIYEANTHEALRRNYGDYTLTSYSMLQNMVQTDYFSGDARITDIQSDYFELLGCVSTEASSYWYQDDTNYFYCPLAERDFANVLSTSGRALSPNENGNDFIFNYSKSENGGYGVKIYSANNYYLSSIFGENCPDNYSAYYDLTLRRDLSIVNSNLIISDGNQEIPIVTVNVDPDGAIPAQGAILYEQLKTSDPITITFIVDSGTPEQLTYTSEVIPGELAMCDVPDGYTIYADEALSEACDPYALPTESTTTFYVVQN